MAPQRTTNSYALSYGYHSTTSAGRPLSPRQQPSQQQDQQQPRTTSRTRSTLQLLSIPPTSPVRKVSAGSIASASVDSTFDINILDNPDLLSVEERRERNGLCIKCGQKLFEMSRSSGGIGGGGGGLFRPNNNHQNVVKIPLCIPGLVERGQCLTCGGGGSGGTTSPTHPLDPSPLRPGAVVGERLSPGTNSVGSGTTTTATGGDDNTNVEGVPHGGMSIMGAPTVGGRATYQGEFNVYGERDGAGTMKWENGDTYTGAFFNGNRHGQGTLCFADGSEYVGEWECNLQHGIGTRRWTNGDCYTGQYLNGKRTGEGRFYFANGDMYTGQWHDGVMEGFGRYYYSSGQRFEGTFRDGKRRGKGKLQRTDGSVDIGVYHRDVRVGLGVRWNADRTVAWKMLDGALRKKISIAEAVAMDYDIDAAVQALDQMEQHRVV